MSDKPPPPPPTLNTPPGGQSKPISKRELFMRNPRNKRLVQLVGFMVLLGIIAALWQPWKDVKRGDGIKAAGELVNEVAAALDKEFKELEVEIDKLIAEKKAEEAVRKLHRMEEIEDSAAEQKKTDDLKAKVSRHIEKEFGKDYIEFEKELLE